MGPTSLKLTQLPGMSIRCRQPRRIITLNLTIIMAYMRRDKKRWGSCVFGWISVMVSGRSFFWKECKMRHGKTWGKIHQDVIDWTCFVVDVEMREELVDVLIPPWIAADGSRQDIFQDGVTIPAFQQAILQSLGSSEWGGTDFSVLNGVIRRARLWIPEGQSRFFPNLETKVGILVESLKKDGFEF